eukprot:364852-Chlamydomonas_euryale.AAC.4
MQEMLIFQGGMTAAVSVAGCRANAPPKTVAARAQGRHARSEACRQSVHQPVSAATASCGSDAQPQPEKVGTAGGLPRLNTLPAFFVGLGCLKREKPGGVNKRTLQEASVGAGRAG